MVHDGAAVRGVIALADAPREESREVIGVLGGLGIDSVMLSGDNNTVSASIAEQVGVDRYYGELLPQDKVMARREALDEARSCGDGRRWH